MSIGPYHLNSPLGSGGFGEVWSVSAPHVQGELALKILHRPDAAAGHGGPSMVDRFLTEARLLQRLSHPGVVRVLDILDLRPDALAYVMEKVDGWSLFRVEAELDAGTLLGIFRRVAEALAYVHSQGLLHRDIKAGNIVVGRPTAAGHCVVKLIDFGIAKEFLAESPNTAIGVLIGTLRGMAPESLDRFNGAPDELTAAVDQWGLGVTMYKTFTGRPPFDGVSLPALMRAIKSDDPPAMRIRPELDVTLVEAELVELIRGLLAKAPGDRFADMEAVVSALAGLEDVLLSGATLVSPPWVTARPPWSVSLPPALALGDGWSLGADADEAEDLLGQATLSEEGVSVAALLTAGVVMLNHPTDEVSVIPVSTSGDDTLLRFEDDDGLQSEPVVAWSEHPPSVLVRYGEGWDALEQLSTDEGPAMGRPEVARAPTPSTVDPAPGPWSAPTQRPDPGPPRSSRWWWVVVAVVGVTCFLTGRYLA